MTNIFLGVGRVIKYVNFFLCVCELGGKEGRVKKKKNKSRKTGTCMFLASEFVPGRVFLPFNLSLISYQ